jgi:hypothetical protein
MRLGIQRTWQAAREEWGERFQCQLNAGLIRSGLGCPQAVARKRPAGDAGTSGGRPATKKGRFQLDLRPKCVAVTIPAAVVEATASVAELQQAVAAALGGVGELPG